MGRNESNRMDQRNCEKPVNHFLATSILHPSHFYPVTRLKNPPQISQVYFTLKVAKQRQVCIWTGGRMAASAFSMHYTMFSAWIVLTENCWQGDTVPVGTYLSSVKCF